MSWTATPRPRGPSSGSATARSTWRRIPIRSRRNPSAFAVTRSVRVCPVATCWFESYLDTGNREFFQNGGDVIDLNVGLAGIRPSVERDTHSRAPFVYDARSVLPVWERLAERAEQLGYAAPEMVTTMDPAPRLAVDG